MSMLALPENECHEILSLFRQHLPHIPNVWLQEVAANYGLDAVVDIDPNDVIAILSVPGKLHRIDISLAEHMLPIEAHRRVNTELVAQGIESGKIVASLLTIHDSSAKLAEIAELVQRATLDYGDKVKKGWAWYAPTSNPICIYTMWIVVCFTSSDAHPGGSQS